MILIRQHIDQLLNQLVLGDILPLSILLIFIIIDPVLRKREKICPRLDVNPTGWNHFTLDVVQFRNELQLWNHLYTDSFVLGKQSTVLAKYHSDNLGVSSKPSKYVVDSTTKARAGITILIPVQYVVAERRPKLLHVSGKNRSDIIVIRGYNSPLADNPPTSRHSIQ